MNISLTLFIQALTKKIYKILPLKESEERGEKIYLQEYLDSVLIEMIGACDTFQSLQCNSDYISVLNTTQYLSKHIVSSKDCKREVFKMLNLLNKIEKESGGEIE